MSTFIEKILNSFASFIKKPTVQQSSSNNNETDTSKSIAINQDDTIPIKITLTKTIEDDSKTEIIITPSVSDFNTILDDIEDMSKKTNRIISVLKDAQEQILPEEAKIGSKSYQAIQNKPSINISTNETKKITLYDQKNMSELEAGTLLNKESKNEESIPVTSETTYESKPIRDVPYWGHSYIYSAKEIRTASLEQRKFYSYFKEQFLNGVYIDIKENSNYAFILLFDLIDDYKKHNDLLKTQTELTTLGEQYPKTKFYTMRSLSEAMISNYHVEDSTEPKTQKCEWIRHGKEVIIQGFKITRGNFYIGEKFLIPQKNRKYYYDVSYLYASIINKDLPISDISKRMTLFHSYNDMDSYSRYLYLKWLAGEIESGDVPIEILSLHLSGLTLRMFFDKQATIKQRRDILTEVIDLKRLFSFCERDMSHHFFCDFIGAAITKYFSNDPLAFVNRQELNKLKTYKIYIINELFKTHGVIDCKLAYEFAKEWLSDSDNHVPQEYEQFAYNLFSVEFNKLHNKERFENINTIKSDYYSNSYSYDNYGIAGSQYFPERINMSCEIIKTKFYSWDIEQPIKDCYYKVRSCFYEYNRAVESNNGDVSLEALFLLPKQIDISDNEKVNSLTTFIDNKLLNNKYSVVNVNDIMKLWDYAPYEKSLPKRVIDSIHNSFDRLSYGIAPDYRVHGPRFKQDDRCVLFTKVRKTPIKTDDLYLRIRAIIKMAVILVQADGEIALIEKEYILNYIKAHFTNNTKIKYLYAHFEYLILSKQKYTGLKQYNSLFNEQSVIELNDFLIKLALVDNELNSKEIDTIKKIMTYFDVDSSDIHSKIHRVYTGEDDKPITIAKESGAIYYAIPKQDEYLPVFQIDTNKLSQMEQDTLKSKQLLSEIFTSDESEDDDIQISTNMQDKLIIILEALLTKESWNRKDVEALCSEHNLMVGSALESINDYAYSEVDDAVIEDDGEIIYVTIQYKDKLICQN